MYTAYFDESGTHGSSEVLIVAGYIASVEQWVQFEADWKELLLDADVDALHMRDFNPSLRQFAPWKNEWERREMFRKRVVKVIRTHVRRGFAGAVILRDYAKVNLTYHLEDLSLKPYPLAALNCVNKGEKWRKEHTYVEPIRYVFEDGMKGKNQICDVLRGNGLQIPEFKQKADCLAFQIADFAANTLHRYLTKLLTGRVPKERDYFPELNSIPNDFAVWEETYLDNFCRTHNVPERA
jgi:Protein of unknown function (DUF3800)